MPFERISTNHAGEESLGTATDSDLSRSGRYVVYSSTGDDIVGGHANPGQGVYLRDMETGVVRRIDKSVDGTPLDGVSYGAKTSADGRFVTYTSTATNLVGEGVDDNGRPDVFLYDRLTGQTRLVTVGQDGTTANGRSQVGAISEDGRYVAYISEANDIRDAHGDWAGGADTNDRSAFGHVARDVFVFDRLTGETKIFTYGGENQITQAVAVWAVDNNGVPSYSTDQVSRPAPGWDWTVHHRYFTPHASGIGNPYAAPMSWASEDGAYAIEQDAGKWTTADRPFDIRGSTAGGQVRIRDERQVDWRGAPDSKTPEIVLAANGRFVVYTSNFDVNDQVNTDGVCLYLWDMDAGTVVLLAQATAGDPFKGLRISANGEWISFTTALALGADDTNGASDVYRIQNPLGSTNTGAEADFPDSAPILGSDGSDVLLGTGGHEVIDALAGDDIVFGQAGDDVIWGRDGADALHGNEGDDRLIGGVGNDVVIGWSGNDQLQGDDGDDTLFGDSETSPEGEAGDGDDVLIGGKGRDLLFGNGGADRLHGGDQYDELRGGDGDDRLYGGGGEDLVLGGEGDDLMYGNDAQTLEADLGDTMIGGAGDDVVIGAAGDDRLYGDIGNDTLRGGDDNDFLSGGAGADLLEGGDGDDHLAGDVTMGPEDSANDRMYGGRGNDVAEGHRGDDFIYGGSGDDELHGHGGDDFIEGDGAETDDGEDSSDEGNDKLYGGDGDDNLSGGGGEDELDGEDGNDFLIGGDGMDVIDGGAGRDSIMGGGGGDVIVGRDGDDIIIGDDLTGVAGDDLISGDAGNDSISGGGGEDEITGDDGDDIVRGEAGDDVIFGGADNDTLSGGADDDVLTGDAGNDLLIGGFGTDRLSGGGGNDTLHADGDDGAALARSAAAGAAAAGGDVLDGGAGADTLFAGTDTTLIGGAGSDTFVIDMDDSGVVIQDLRAGPGGDVVSIQSLGVDVSNWDGDTNLFATGHLRTEARGSDTILLFDADGYEGAGQAVELATLVNTVPGTLTSANINFDDLTYVINDPRRTSVTRGVDDSETLSGTEGHDTLLALAGDDLVLGLAGHDELKGGEGRDDLRGGDGDDVLSGDDDDDTLDGGAGNDVISGGSGTDVLNGGDGNDRFLVDSGQDRITGGAGADTIVASRYSTATTVVLDFDLAGGDVIDMSVAAPGLNFEYLQAFMLSTDANGDVLIRVDGLRRSYISLKGIKLEDLTADHFKFTPEETEEPDPENRAPTAISIDAAEVAENAAVGTVVGTVSATDPDGDALVYSLVDDADGRFSIDAATGVVTANQAFDHEGTASFEVTVRATDADGLFVERTLTIQVDDVNEGPGAIGLDDAHIDENAEAGSVVGAVSAADPDGDSLTYSLVDDADGLFAIDPATGAITTTRAFDHETEAAFDLVVRATDPQGLFVDRTVSILVDDLDEAPLNLSMDAAAVDENAAAGALVGTASAGDPEGDPVVYSLVDDAGGLFVIDAQTGAVTTTRPFDHETESTFEIVVRATDPGGLYVDHAQTVEVGDVNEAPTDISVDGARVAENAAAGTAVGTASATDPEDDVLVYSLVDDAEGRFRIDPATGRITTTRSLDHEATPSLRIVIRATDPTGAWVDREATITVENVNEGPTGADDGPLLIDEDATSANLWSLLLANDVSDGGALSIASVDTTGAKGSVIFDAATQTLRYVADADAFDLLAPGATVTDSFTYTVTDASGLTSTATVTFTVRGVADGRVIKGSNGKDTLTGTAGEDVITGLNGNDTLHGLDGADRLDGGNGVDKLYGGAGIDSLIGGNGDDVLDGGAGADSLDGGLGQDQLFGGAGDDFILGGGGHDLLTGGAGADTFVFGIASDIDKILDFEVGKDSLSFVDGVEVLFHEILDNNNDGKLDTVLVHSLGGVIILLGVEYPVGPSLEEYVDPCWAPSTKGLAGEPIDSIL